MNTQYYIISDGAQKGPYSFDQLRMMGLDPNTYVWTPGMEDWKKAADMPQLASLFGLTEEEESAFGGYARPEEPAPYRPQAQVPPVQQYNIPHTNWQPWAICATVVGALFSCIGMIFGIIGIVNASKANKYYMMGDEVNGKMSNSTARTMTIIGLALALVGIVLSILGLPFKIATELMQNLN